MNAKQIQRLKKSSPKAFELFLKFMGYYKNCTGSKTDPSPIMCIQMQLILGNERILYDFFDKRGIFINVFINVYNVKSSYWDWEIYVNNQCLGSSEVEEPNRKEAENIAFEMAFNILEKQ